jgi:hypothetical protein
MTKDEVFALEKEITKFVTTLKRKRAPMSVISTAEDALRSLRWWHEDEMKKGRK